MARDYEGDNEMQAVIDTALTAAEPTPLDGDEGRFWGYVLPHGGTVKVVDLEEQREQFAPAPRRKTGLYRVHDAESFIAYMGKHGDTDSEVWADLVQSTITGVVDAHHTGLAPRWEQHRVKYAVQHTEAWIAWMKHNGTLTDQTTFAEHLENRSIDVVDPSGADMLELAQNFQATTGVQFKSSKLLSSGESTLEYREELDAKVGRAGQMEIPSTFTLALTPFEGAARFKVTARLRYRITGGQLRIGYQLDRPNDVLREAFQSVVDEVDAGVDCAVYRGSTGS